MSRLAWTLFNALQWLLTLFWTAGWICLALLVRCSPAGATGRFGWRRAAGSRLAARRRRTAGSAWPGADRLVLDARVRGQSPVDDRYLRAVPRAAGAGALRAQAGAGEAPFVGWYARAMGMVFIERGSTRDSARQLHAAVDVVRAGASVCAFPEGTRSREGRVAPFKGSAFQLAIEAGASVVPVAIEGSGKVLPAAGFRGRPVRIVVRLGEPLPTQGLAPHDRNTLAQQAPAAVAALLGEPPAQ